MAPKRSRLEAETMQSIQFYRILTIENGMTPLLLAKYALRATRPISEKQARSNLTQAQQCALRYSTIPYLSFPRQSLNE